MTEEGKPAEGTATPAEPAVEAPAPGNDSAPASDPKTLVEQLKAELGSNLSTTEKRLLAEVERAAESARRAQSSSDKNAARLTAQFERRFASLESLVTAGFSEEQLRVWRAETENARLKAEREGVDADTKAQEDREEFGRWSGRVLADEKIDQNDPVFSAAWQRYGAEARTPAEWRDALWRSVTAYRKAEGDKRVEDERKRASEVVDQERKKATNTRRDAAGPIDTASGSGTAYDPNKPPADDKAFADWWEKKKQERRQRQLEQMAR